MFGKFCGVNYIYVDGFFVKQGVVFGDCFEGVGVGVIVIENCLYFRGFCFVLNYYVCFELVIVSDDLGECWVVVIKDGFILRFQLGEKFSIEDYVVFYDFGEFSEIFVFGKSCEYVGVDLDVDWLLKSFYYVFGGVQIDFDFVFDVIVYLGEQSCGNLSEMNILFVGSGDEFS